MKNLACAVLVACVAASAPISARQNSFTLDQVLARLEDASKTFRSVEANIEQKKVTVIVNDVDTKTGKIFYTKRGSEPRLKLEFNKPQAEFVLIDNGKLQIYLPKIKQVQEASTSGHQDLVEMFLALGFGQTSQDLKRHFDVSLAPNEIVDGQQTTVLDLKPKDSGTFQSVRLWLDQKAWHAVQIKTVEKSGDYFTVKYSNIKMNAGIPDSRFKLDLPKDVKVIRL